jgi:hypothetical protein
VKYVESLRLGRLDGNERRRKHKKKH